MSIFNQPFASGVQNQIRARQNAIQGAFGTRSPGTIQYFNTRNAWIRMSSAVNVNGSKGLVTSNVLMGGTLAGLGSKKTGIGSSTSNAYSSVSSGGSPHRLGIRPMPGITSLEVKTKSAYGSLRYATVNFVCWDIRQLEELEVLYMRPGYSVLVEWGWSPYLDNGGNLVSSNPPFTNDVLNGGTTKEAIWKSIYNKSISTGNYDAMYGFVQNYNWSTRNDGGYDCSTTIITMGEILESLKAPFTDGESGATRDTRLFTNIGTPIPTDNRTIAEAYTRNKISGIAVELYKASLLNYGGGGNSGPWSYTDPNNSNKVYDFYVFKIPINVSDPTLIENDLHTYIRLENFIDILNRYIIPEDKNGYKVATYSVRDTSGNPLECIADKRQISVNPTVCMIKNDNYSTTTSILQKLGVGQVNPILYRDFLDPLNNNKSYFTLGSNYTSAIIGNIYINLDFIYRLSQEGALSSQDKKEKNDIIIIDFVRSLLNSCNTAIGNVANFNVFIDPKDSVARIVDVNFTGTRTTPFTIELQNLKSVVRNYKIESQIFPELSSIIAIGAQVQGGAQANEVNTLIDYNKGLTDRIVTEKVSPNSTALSPQQKLDNVQDSFAEFLTGLFGFFLALGPTRYDPDKSARLANSLRDLINLFQTYERGDATNRSILPTKLSIEIDGIGGVIIGNVFKIPNDVLPQGYKGTGANIGYVVTGIGHSIQNNDWVTKIDAQFILLDNPFGTKRTPRNTLALPPLPPPPPPIAGPTIEEEISFQLASGVALF